MFKWIQSGWAQLKQKWVQDDASTGSTPKPGVGSEEHRRLSREKAQRYDDELARRKRIWAEDEEAVVAIMAFLEVKG